MVKLSGERIDGQRNEISEEDALQVRLLYGCVGERNVVKINR